MNELLSQPHYDFTVPFTLDNKVTVYIDKSCEPMGFIKNLIHSTDSLVDFKFKIVKKKKNAEVRFYEKDIIDNNPSYLGLAVPLENGWDLLIRKDAGVMKKWAYIHEFGHSLGLEHPFDDRDGDVWENTTTDDTVMSYKYISSNNWFFRKADIDTITGAWCGR